jgi:hypothetical protein
VGGWWVRGRSGAKRSMRWRGHGERVEVGKQAGRQPAATWSPTVHSRVICRR